MATVSLKLNGLDVRQLRNVLATWNKIKRTDGLVPTVYREQEVTVKCEGPDLFTCTVPPMFHTVAHLFSQIAFDTEDVPQWERELLGLI